MKRRAWLLYLLAGIASLLVWETVPALKIGPVYDIIVLSSPVAILVAVRMWRPGSPEPWYLFAAAQTFFVTSDVIAYNYHRAGAPMPFPSARDVATLAVYPCLILGILMVIRRRTPGKDRASLLDSLIVALGIGAVSWAFLMAPVAHDPDSTVIQKTVSMAYPVLDLVLLTLVVRLAVGTGRRAPAFLLMAGATFSLFYTDFIYGYITGQGIPYRSSGALEAGWALFYILWGAAALHGSMGTITEREPDQETRLTSWRLWLLAAAALTAQGVRAVQLALHKPSDEPVLMAASAAVFLLVVARMADLVHRQEQSAAREKALREAGAALVTATNRPSIYAAALDAARSLTGDLAAIQLLVSVDDPAGFRVEVSSGTEPSPQGGHVPSNVLPARLWDQLRSHRPVRATGASDGLASALCLPEEGELYVVPLFIRDEIAALLLVSTPRTLPRSTRDGLDALSSQVALALESAALTEDLVRRQSEARFSSLVQNSSDVIMVVAADSSIRFVSPSAERVFGHPTSVIEGAKLTSFIHPEDRSPVLSYLTTSAHYGLAHPGMIEFRMRRQDDSWLHVETLATNLLDDENVRGIVLNTRDIGERKAFEEQLEHQAFYDPVTGLANRALFRDRVEHALERQRRGDRPISVLFLDLDDFKTINDSLGHEAGDRLLAEVGDRLHRTLRSADTAARFGGDEFAILLEDGGEGIGAADVASRILQALEAPIQLEGKEVFVHASIGIASADPTAADQPETAEEILRDADVAMYMAKEAGKARYQIFEPTMHDYALKRLELKADLQRAVDNGEFVLHYQPVIELGSGKISGLEALVRWQHPVRGMVPPLDFIPLAEETGLIVTIGRWVMREACGQAVRLQERFAMDPPLDIAVNLSARQLQRPEIVEEVAATLATTGLEPHRLVLEITESVMMRDVELSLQRLTELKALGVRLAVDDFGIGYSSLNYIQQFPVDILKVDKSFVDAFNVDARKSALTATIIKLAEDLDLAPVAEGIERADQLERLLELQCDLGQGYYFARPLPMDGVDDLLTTRSALANREPELSA
jgi:diguanylate cyclase (GGDEF)-like protein/PAS domain S-box-containing protein